MKLFMFSVEGRRRCGFELRGQLVDAVAAFDALQRSRGPQPDLPPTLPPSLLMILRMGPAGLAAMKATAEFLGRRPALPAGDRITFDSSEVKLHAPIARPGKMLFAGINYKGHIEENPNAKMPTEPFFFAKMASTVIGPGDAIQLPISSRQVDYEVELAVVIGARMKNVSAETALLGIAGYTIINDVSARDVQFKDSQITLGKNFDTFCPMGPCLVTADEIANPGGVALKSYVNGELMQNGSTRDWVFPLGELLANLSGVMTLEPGDVVSTGTPAGVGVFRKPPVFLKMGDVVRVEVEGIGVLENPVV